MDLLLDMQETGKDNAKISKIRDIVENSKRKELIFKTASVLLYPDKIEVKKDGELKETFSFDEIKAVTVLGKNKLNIYRDKDIFQLKPSKSFNAVKYVNIFHRYKNIKAGKENDEFLGL